MIAIRESEKGALMAYVPYRLLVEGLIFEGTHQECIGTKDGSLQDITINNLREIFPTWESQNPFDLQRVELMEGDDVEFTLVDWHNEPYVTSGGKTVDKWCFKYINKPGRGTSAPSTEEEESATLAKWGVKFGLGKPAASEKKSTPGKSAAKETPTTTKPTPGKKAKAPKVWTDATVWLALAVKNGLKITKDADGDDEVDPDTSAEKLDPVVSAYYAGQNEAIGYDSTSGNEISAEQWGKVAAKLEL